MDPTTAAPEELELALAAAQEAPALVDRADSLRGFLDIARVLQGPLAPLLVRGPGARASDAGALEAILVRDLLANPAVLPIITARGAAAVSDRPPQGHIIRARAAARVRALTPDEHETALAAEEPVEIAGFAVDPAAAGSAVLLRLGVGAFLGADVSAQSGACPAAVLAITGPGGPPEYVVGPAPDEATARLAKRGFAPVFLGAGDPVRALLLQARSAAEYYLSGAAATASLSRLAAAVHGTPGAEPELLAAVGPSSSALSDAGGFLVSAPVRGVAPPPWRAPADQERLRYLVGRLARTEPIAAADPGTWAYDLSPLNDLYRAGALGVYLYALTEGRESPQLDDFLELAEISAARRAQLGKIRRLATLGESLARQYLIIIEDRFGAERVQTILEALRVAVGLRARSRPGGAVQVDDPGAVLGALTKREKELVLVELENRRLEWEAAVNNKCPHVRLARRTRAATSAKEALAALQELAKYFVEPPKGVPHGARPAPETQWHLCRNCGFRALCPHVCDRVRLEARRAGYDEVRTRLLKYAVRASAGAGAGAYYCSICSERLAEDTEEDRVAERMGRYGDLDVGLRSRVWSAALSAARHVRFPTPTDERQFASAATAVVYPLLTAAEEAVAKKGRRRRQPRAGAGAGADADEEDLDPRTLLYAVLFVYAYILDLVRASRGARAQEVGFANVKLDAKEGVYAEQMLRLVAEEHRGLLSQIEDITAEYLRARFTEAYRIVRSESTGGLQAANPEEELAVQATTIDPVYRYGATVARVAGDLPLARPGDPAGARREFEVVLGATLPAVIKLARESAKDPDLAPLYLRRTGVEVPPGGSLEFLVKDPRVNLYAAMYEPKASVAGRPAIDAFRGISAVLQRAPLSWVGSSEKRGAKTGKATGWALGTRPANRLELAERGYFFESYRLFAQYSKGVTSQEAFEAYRKDLSEVRQGEEGLLLARSAFSLKSYYDFGFTRSLQYAPVSVPITATRDEDGRRHDWSAGVTYYYSRGGAPPVRIKGGPSGVKAARDSGELTPDMVLVDLGCPVCGVQASRVGELDVEKTWRSVVAMSEIDSFFVFYESRCPAGELHDWDRGQQDTPCRKCGLTASVLKDVAGGKATTNAKARAYYDKYAPRFSQERRTARGAPIGAEAHPRAPEQPADASAWKSDYTLIVRAAELANVPPTVIEAIGSMEGREYNDIAEGRDIPPPPGRPSDPRIYGADAEVRYLLGEYGVLRNVLRIVRPPPDLLELLAAAGAPKHEWGDLPQVFPDIGAGYRAMFSAILRGRPPADALDFAIQSLCRIVVEVGAVAAADREWVARLAKGFAKKVLLRILRSQKLFSKPGLFNWAIFEAEDGPDQDQVGDVGEDILEEILGADGEEAPEDPFSGEGMDYDTSENNQNNEPS